MSFYQAIQLGANSLKPLIKNAESKEIRNKYIAAIILRTVLNLMFCMFVIVSFGAVFGSENSIVGVVAVLALLHFRFSNLDFNVGQSALTIFGVFCIFAVVPYFASISNPILGFVINFLSIISILILTCHNVKLFNHSILVLSYLLLYGYKIDNEQVLFNRIIGLIFAGILVTSIFYIKQRKIKFENKFSNMIKDMYRVTS